jgi:cytochrome c553
MRKAMMLATIISMVLASYVLMSSAAGANAQDQFDAAGTYKSKCVACHGQAAEKKFDAALPDTELVQAVLKGKKGEKPPNMPGYEEKGINEDQAKALVAHMRSLKK